MSETSAKIPFRFPGWFGAAGAAISIPSAALAARLVWEQTALTWRNGPQMVGFSLMHGTWGILFLAIPALLIWAIGAVAMVVKAVVAKRPIARSVRFESGVAAVIALFLFTPYSTWQRLFIGRLASRADAAEFMDLAAAEGHLALVRAFIASGVDVNARDPHDGKTALHGASVENQVDVVEYLVTAGAKVDALDRMGDSPLAEAQEMHSEESAAYLIAHGAHAIRGSESQRRAAIDSEVDEDIRGLERRAPR